MLLFEFLYLTDVFSFLRTGAAQGPAAGENHPDQGKVRFITLQYKHN